MKKLAKPFRVSVTFLVVVSLIFAPLLTSCGSGGGGSDSGSANDSVPTDVASAISYQYNRVGDVIGIFKQLREEENAAHQALDEERYDDWDAFWQNRYPELVAELATASGNLEKSEEYVQSLVYGDASGEIDGDTVVVELGPAFVPLPLVLLAAAVVTTIYVMEQERMRNMQNAPTQTEQDAFIDQRVAYWKSQGLAPIAAQTRAIADAAQIDTLKGLQTGIEHAKEFVTEAGLKPGFGQYLPDEVSTLVDLQEWQAQLSKISENVQAIFTSKECGSSGSQQPHIVQSVNSGRRWPIDAGRVSGLSSLPTGCRVYFCSTDDGTCPNLPEGDWEAAVFLPGHLRDVDSNVTAVSGQDTTVDIAPVAAEEIDPPDDGSDCAVDADNDGHYAIGSCASPADDCDDNAGSVYPGASEVANDGIDQDCDGEDLAGNGSDDGLPASYTGWYTYFIESVILEPEYHRTVVCDYDGPADITLNDDGSLGVVMGEGSRDSYCAMPIMQPTGTHANGQFTIPFGQITITGTYSDSGLSGSGNFRVTEGSSYMDTVLSLDLVRQE